MRRLLSIELLKLRPAKYFWILLSLFLIILIGIPIATYSLGSWITENLMPSDSPISDILPFYDFADIWHNFTFLFMYFTFLLSSLVVINVAQEFSLQTARQHVIDGLSKHEFFKAKLLFILVLALVITLVVFVLGLVFGGAYSPVNDMGSVFMNVQYIGAYFLHLMHSFLLAMFVALLIKRTGIGVVVFLFYGWIEPLAEAFIRYYFEWPTIANMLPSAATKVLITNPFMKYGLARTYTSVQPEHLTIAAGWMLLLLFVNYKLVTKRDL